MKIRLLVAVALLAFPGALFAANVQKLIRTEQKFTLAPGGTFVLDNPIGNVDISGADVTAVEATISTTITAINNAALEEGRRQAGLLIGADPNRRVVRTNMTSPMRNRWSAKVNWVIRMPRTANVRVISTSSDRISITNMLGGVYVKNFNGNVALANTPGTTFVESVNGSIIYSTPKPRGNVTLSTVNGHVTATVAGDADLRWVAETVTGDILTSGLAPRGAFIGQQFRGTINAPGGPTITTASMMGNINLLAAGAAAAPAQSIRRMPATIVAPASPQTAAMLSSSTGPRVLRRGLVKESFSYSTNIGDVRIQEIRGDAQIYTGAGEVQLGAVNGAANVRSMGGPLEIGEVLGILTASTSAGDILVDSTRRGGTIETKGGTIRLLYTSGPTRLISGGGDITVRQTTAPVYAQTDSGDVTITVDPNSKTEKIEARSGKGNLVLNVDSKFGADIDATIITTAPGVDTISSDIPGLSVSRRQVNGKTHVRATGKLNGGGQKVTLQTTGGDIRISSARVAPTIVKPR